MGEEVTVSEKPMENGDLEVKKVEDKAEVVADKKLDQHDGATEMMEDKGGDSTVEAVETNVNEEVIAKGEEMKENGGDETEAKEGMDESIADAKMQDVNAEDGGKDEAKSVDDVDELKEEKEKTEKSDDEGKEEESKPEDKKTEDPESKSSNVQEPKEEEEKTEELREEEEKIQEPREGKSSTKRPRSKGSAGKKDKTKIKEPELEEKQQKTPTEKKKGTKASAEKKDREPKTPTASTPTTDRPVRERKSVERLVAVIEQDNAKEFQVEKGRGTALKDIPRVAYKMSRKKTDDNLKMLHTILFGRRGKAALVKSNMLQFSGFVWHGDEEKQMAKVKEKLDKCVKEKLVEFCDVFDIPISKSNAKKDDMVAKLIEFLLEPHATKSESPDDKQQDKKRKRLSNSSSKGSAKIRKKDETTSKKGGKSTNESESKDDSEQEEEEDDHGSPRRSDDEMSQGAESESEKDSDEDKGKKREQIKSSDKKGSSAKKQSSEKNKSKKVTISKKTSPLPKKSSIKSPPSHPRSTDASRTKKASGTKKEESTKKSSTSKKPALKESTGKKVLKETSKPSDDDLKNAICEILKEVDFNTATFTDILKMLTTRFDTDLTPRKSSLKIMIQDELTRIADAEEDEEDKGGAENDEKKEF